MTSSGWTSMLNRTLVIRSIVFLHDVAVAVVAYLGAIALRADTLIGWDNIHFSHIGLIVVTAIAVNGLIGRNRDMWRYASIPDLLSITRFAAVTVGAFAVLVYVLLPQQRVPIATLIIMFMLTVLGAGTLRIAYRLMRSRRAVVRSRVHRKTNTLLIGVTDNTEQFIKAAGQRTDLNFRPLGIIDDRTRRIGLSIHGVKVLSDIAGMSEAVANLDARSGTPIEAMILTKSRDKFTDEQFESILEFAAERGLKLLRLPEINTLTSNLDDQAMRPSPVKLEDLLSRPPKKLTYSILNGLTRNATVLVTGAGGSIGSEISRQILALAPRELILLDSSEFLLFTIQQELLAKAGTTKITAVIGDVRDRNRIRAEILKSRPDFVLHAAALKHVPMVEEQPLEGLLTNVIGTRNVADACVAARVKAMVMISTDKAVNPTNVMGASKRLAEMYCQSLDVHENTRFVTVRFGNVLGSAGSVVPIFEKQIAAGGPVTVTHPDIERFFMTIPEAVSLVLHATGYALGVEDARGSVFVLDMGKPVKIVDMARKLIQLSGFRPDTDIKIVFTGLRPGEKLYEELFTDGEGLIDTGVPSIKQASPHTRGLASVTATIDELQMMINRNDESGALRILIDADCRYEPTIATSARIQSEKHYIH